jgi:hypothetical protein
MMGRFHNRLDPIVDRAEQELPPSERRLLGALNRVYRATPSSHLDTRMMVALQRRTLVDPLPDAPGPARGLAAPRRRLISAGAALALVIGGSAGYLQLHQPAPVSAQVVLRHVASALPQGSDQVVHEIQVTTDHTKVGDPAQVQETWTQLDATGSVQREMRRLSDGNGTLLFYSVMDGSRTEFYDAFYNKVETNAAAKLGQVGNNPYGVVELRQLIQSAQSGDARRAQIEPQQQLDGATVDVVKLFWEKGAGMATLQDSGRSIDSSRYKLLYVDPSSYAIEGVDEYVLDPHGAPQLSSSMRVTLEATMPVAAVPSGMLTFTAPAGARTADAGPLCPAVTLPHPIAVAQAVADQSLPAPLLAGDVAGLHLASLTRIDISQDSAWAFKHSQITYTYQTPGGVPFTVSVSTGGPQGPAAEAVAMLPKTMTQTQTAADGTTITDAISVFSLNLDGKPVPASYEETVNGTHTSQDLSYNDPSTGLVVDVFSGLDHESFLAAVATLVDGHMQPALVSQLQRELNVAPPAAASTSGQGPATATPQLNCVAWGG